MENIFEHVLCGLIWFRFRSASNNIETSGFPAQAGILSGFSGIESVPGPELPRVEFLNRWNGNVHCLLILFPIDASVDLQLLNISDENQKKYAENDARFKESPILKKLLEQSKLNKEK